MEINKELVQKIIKEDNAEALVTEAEKIGKYLAKTANPVLSSSQIRNVYGSVKKLSLDWTAADNTPERSKSGMRELLLLKPKLAYQVGRVGKNRSDAIQTMKDVLEHGIDVIGGDYIRFKRFVEFFEAILAYHKAYGGK